MRKESSLVGKITIALAGLLVLPLISIVHILKPQPFLDFLIYLILVYIFIGGPMVTRIIVGIQIMRSKSYARRLMISMLWAETMSVIFLILTTRKVDWMILIPANIFIAVIVVTLSIYYLVCFRIVKNKEPGK